MGKNLLYLRRAHKDPSPKDDRHLVYVLVEGNIKAAALEAVSALTRLDALGQSYGCEFPSCSVHYRNRALAEKNAKRLRDLDLQKNHGVHIDTTDEAFRDLICDSGDMLRLHYTTFLVNEPDVHTLLAGVISTEIGRVFTLNRRQKQLTSKYCSVFLPASIQEIDAMPDIPVIERGQEAAELAGAMEIAHHKIVAFLQLLLNRCLDARPLDATTPTKIHVCQISSDLDVTIDGNEIHLNEARRASLLALAILGTEKISLKAFAELYCCVPIRNRTVNLPNVFAKATNWICGFAPSFEIRKTDFRNRQLVGLTFACEASPQGMQDFLDGRRANADGM